MFTLHYIGIGRLLFTQLIVQVFIFLTKSKHTKKWVCFVTLLLGAFLLCLHFTVLEVSESPRITIGALINNLNKTAI